MCVVVVGSKPTSAGKGYCCLMIVDNAINIDRPVGLLDNDAAPDTNGFRTFVPVVHAYGSTACPRTVNGHVFTNKGFQIQMADGNIGRVNRSADGPKRNGRVGRNMALGTEDGIVAVQEFHIMFDGVEFAHAAGHRGVNV